jgi:hypothetical protein
MTIRDLPDDQRIDAIRAEARRLAASGTHTTWHEVADACLEQGMTQHEVHSVFDVASFREEIEALAEQAHGVGGRATS